MGRGSAARLCVRALSTGSTNAAESSDMRRRPGCRPRRLRSTRVGAGTGRGTRDRARPEALPDLRLRPRTGGVSVIAAQAKHVPVREISPPPVPTLSFKFWRWLPNWHNHYLCPDCRKSCDEAAQVSATCASLARPVVPRPACGCGFGRADQTVVGLASPSKRGPVKHHRLKSVACS